MTSRMPEAVCNTSPIQYLHQVDLLHLLPRFYSRILVPPAVVQELTLGKALGVNLPDIHALAWVQIQQPKGLDKVPIGAELGAGEKEVLALALQTPDAVAILDDHLARLHATALRLKLTGTLGILLRAKGENAIPLIEPVIRQLDHLGFRLSARTREAVLRQAGESDEFTTTV